MHALVIALGLVATQSPDLGGGTQPGELQNGLAPPTSCAQCHSTGAQDSEMPVDLYKGSMMYLASVDPIYLAALEVAFNDGGDEAVLCVRCHVPTGFLAGRALPGDGSALSNADKHGVNCDVCHRAMEAPPPIPADAGPDAGAQDAGVVVDAGDAGEAGDAGPPPFNFDNLLLENTQLYFTDENVKFGPFETDQTQTHTGAYSPLIEDSRLCAHCHEVTNPVFNRVLLDGTDTGEPFPVERTYTEWRNSAFATEDKSCASCHLKATSGFAATDVGPVPTRDLGRHDIVGGNTIVPSMVAHLYQGTNIDYLQDLAPHAARIEAAAEALLKEESAELAVQQAQNDGDPELVVRVTNLSGHKLPTGYAEGRRMWLGHEVTYAGGVEGPKSGRPDLTTWDFQEDPAHIWEIRLGTYPDGESFHFLLANTVYKDNRIPPRGFVSTPDTAPVGATFDDAGGGTLAHWSDVTLPLGDVDCWPVVVDTKLYYQTASGEYYRFLLDNAPNARAQLESAWNAVGGSIPVVMRELRVVIDEDLQVTPLAADAPVPTCDDPQLDAGDAPDAAVPELDAGEQDAGGGIGEPPVDACACGHTDGPRQLPAAVGALALLGLASLLGRRRQRQAPHLRRSGDA
jgi:MYXO-CTERM domain-containing protein